MNLSTPVKAIALVVFLAALAGATYGVQQLLGPNMDVRAAREVLNATPGHTVSFPIVVTNHGGARSVEAVLASAEGEGVEGRSARVELGRGNATVVFVPVEVPQGLAPGEHRLSLRLVDEDNRTLRERADVATLRVLAPEGPAFGLESVAEVIYTGRTADDGVVFDSNDPALRNLTFPGSGFRLTRNPSPLEARGGPLSGLVEGFTEGMTGMVEGESRTITFPPEKGYGNGTIEERIERRETLQRRETLPLPEASLTTSQFAGYIAETQGVNPGSPEEYDVGDVVINAEDGQELRYRIVNKTAQGVQLRLQVETGERYSLYPFWREASVVEDFNETHATFYTTPTVEEGASFTYYPHWPDLSIVERLTEDSIVLRHDPAVGLKYMRTISPTQPPRQYTVVSVGEDAIVVSTPTGHQLAGKTLTFDVLLLRFTQ